MRKTSLLSYERENRAFCGGADRSFAAASRASVFISGSGHPGGLLYARPCGNRSFASGQLPEPVEENRRQTQEDADADHVLKRGFKRACCERRVVTRPLGEERNDRPDDACDVDRHKHSQKYR